MKHSILICARSEPDLLRLLANSLFAGGVFPAFLSSEAVGFGTVRIRMELDCDHTVIAALRAGWGGIAAVQSVVVSRRDDPVREPATATD